MCCGASNDCPQCNSSNCSIHSISSGSHLPGISFERLEPIKLKGKEQSTDIFIPKKSSPSSSSSSPSPITTALSPITGTTPVQRVSSANSLSSLIGANSNNSNNSNNTNTNTNCKYLIGREQELNTILNSFDKMKAEGKGAVMIIKGFHGVGKTAIVNEVCDRLSFRQEAIVVKGMLLYIGDEWMKMYDSKVLIIPPYIGHCVDMKRTTSYFVLSQILMR